MNREPRPPRGIPRLRVQVAVACAVVVGVGWLVLHRNGPPAARDGDHPVGDATSPSTERSDAPAPPVGSGAGEGIIPVAAPSVPTVMSTPPAAGSVRSHGKAVALIRGRGSAHGTFMSIREGPDNGTDGLKEVLAALDDFMGLMGEGAHPWRGPALLARANAEHALGHPDRSLATFIDALLAMDSEGPSPPWGIPRLHFFAQGPNLAPYSEEERAQRGSGDATDETRSGGWAFVGGSPLIGRGTEGREFGRWLETVARSEENPEAALAATIWLHAVGWREGWIPPAWSRLISRWRPGSGMEGAALDLALQDGLLQEDPEAMDLRSELDRMRAWAASAAAVGRSPLPGGTHLVWSLRQEVHGRFLTVDSETGRALLRLADRLVAWE